MKTELANAFRFHRQTTRNPRHWQKPAPNPAWDALNLARQDVANSKARYPGPVKPYPAAAWQYAKRGIAYVESPESSGLRLVGRVEAECGGRNGYWAKRETCGWYTDPHGDGSGLCYGVVYQLPGRKGQSRFVAGYQFGGVDGGPTLDLGTIYASPDNCSYDGAQGNDAARDAARAADSMAQAAAESEREYQTAWAAGSDYADKGQDIADTRAELLAILAERRAVKGKGEYPALCAAITSKVRDLLAHIEKQRIRRRELVEGERTDLYFWPGEKRLQAAFCEGAGLDSFPA